MAKTWRRLRSSETGSDDPVGVVGSRSRLADMASGRHASGEPDIAADRRAMADGDTAEDRRSGVDDDVVLDDGMARLTLDQGAVVVGRKIPRAERDRLIE